MVQNDIKSRKILGIFSFFSAHLSFLFSKTFCFVNPVSLFLYKSTNIKLAFVNTHTKLSCTITTSYICMIISFKELCTALRFAPSVL